MSQETFGLADIGAEVARRVRSFFLISSVIGLVLGIVLLIWPDKTLQVAATVLTVVLSIFFIVLGIARLAVGVIGGPISGWMRVFFVLIGILLIICGAIGLRNLSATEVVYTLFAITLVAVGWIIEGIVSLVEARRTPATGWSIFYGIISIAGGVSLLMFPLEGAVTLIWVSGIFLVAGGIVGIIRAVQLGKVDGGRPVTSDQR
ncbi:HdeD family acid-resistance protein [Naumannella cuiyingiana]|uniref:Uncharacterized membrane protein HdeD (DUF308 family) n=1 Tax=Naumannella cuiyingiana TaxID=1347891 RepID=A0A7Z0ILB8_9ACTN|nr:DUF308 domain-containing protein [Naumannella cuiyingiana]NYI71362.1 uncharacterized membrane protein HdeD (DUF308 family) [Naumannella cuiyingiana]